MPHPAAAAAAAAAVVASTLDVSGVRLPGASSPPRPVQASRRTKGGNWCATPSLMYRTE
jgi:hypothetical protein